MRLLHGRSLIPSGSLEPQVAFVEDALRARVRDPAAHDGLERRAWSHGALGGVARPSSLKPQQVAERSTRIPQLWCSPASTEMNSPSGGVA